MLVTAGENFEGYKITDYIDIVIANATSAEGAAYRQNAIKKACNMAETKGANAIVNMNMQICPLSENLQEVTVYGNAVIIESKENKVQKEETHKVNLEAYLPKEKSKKAEMFEASGLKFVACPRCGTKYKTDMDENGKIYIKGFEDVDDSEPGLQIYCLRCGTKFTVPGA